MSRWIALALLTASFCAPVLADGPAPVVGPAAVTGTVAVAQAAQSHKRAEVSPYTPSEDCCFVDTDLDRPMPGPRVERGPSCCWDASNWE